jgi:hypothetical protein
MSTSEPENLGEILQMRAERRQARLDRLLVSDIGERVVEDRDAALRTDRRRDSGLRQRRQQTDRLEQDGLAACVRPGHEERSLVRIHRQIERNDISTLRDEQRVAAVLHVEPLARRDERRGRAGECVGETCAGEQRVELDERVERRDNFVAPRAQLVGQLDQNALDLFDFIRLELAHTVAELDRRRRLDEYRRTGRRRVVHDPAGDRASAATNGNDEPAVAHRHRHVGHAMLRIEALHHAFENSNQLALRGAELAPNPS